MEMFFIVISFVFDTLSAWGLWPVNNILLFVVLAIVAVIAFLVLRILAGVMRLIFITGAILIVVMIVLELFNGGNLFEFNFDDINYSSIFPF